MRMPSAFLKMNPKERNIRSETEETKIQKDRYRVLIEDVADGFYEVDLHGNFKFFNDALCRIFGYAREEIQDHNFTEFMDEANARIAYESFNRIYRTGEGIVDIKWQISRKDGEKRHLEQARRVYDSLINVADNKQQGATT